MRRCRSLSACDIRDGRGITLDASLGDSDLAILFSYTRAYFRVMRPCHIELVRYLRQLMPRKRLNDLYNSIGHPRTVRQSSTAISSRI